MITRYKPAEGFIIIKIFINKRDIIIKNFYKDFYNYVFINDLINKGLNKKNLNEKDLSERDLSEKNLSEDLNKEVFY